MDRHSHRTPSVADSMAEYFDASEVIVCESSSEADASDESGLSDITTTSTSEPEEGHGERRPSPESPVLILLETQKYLRFEKVMKVINVDDG